MKIQPLYLITVLCAASFGTTVHSSEFDQYLQQKNIINDTYKITDKAALNELVAALSEEDSRTFPIEIDDNTILEKLEMTADKTTLTGLIITPDFSQFEDELGHKEVLSVIRKNLLNNCHIFFEHEYQKRNPYAVQLNLSSERNLYNFELNKKDCGIE